MKKLVSVTFTVCAVLFISTGFRSDKIVQKGEGIQWITMEEAYAKVQTEPKMVLIDVYTDWCGWCKVMDKETFKNQKVSGYVNQKYYAVKFNAEQTAPVTIGDHTFQYSTENKIHELALALTNNQPSFPTTVFLDNKFQMIQPLPGYMKAKEFHQVITFFGENYNKKEAFEDYKSNTYPKLFVEN